MFFVCFLTLISSLSSARKWKCKPMFKMVEDRFSLITVPAIFNHKHQPFFPTWKQTRWGRDAVFPSAHFLNFCPKGHSAEEPLSARGSAGALFITWYLTWPLMHIIEKQCLKCRRNPLIKLCLFRTNLYNSCIDINRYMYTGTLDIDKYVYTGTKSENPFAIHSNHCCSIQEAQLSPSRQFWYVLIKGGYTGLYLSTRKSAIVGNQSQRDFFHEQAGPELNAALHQLKDSAFLLPEFAPCFTTSDKERVCKHPGLEPSLILVF